jgi:uncharacterized delta-60 repeat protein
MKKHTPKGNVMLIVTLFISIIGATAIMTSTKSIVSDIKNSSNLFKTKQGFASAESGIEDMIYRIQNNMLINSTESISQGELNSNTELVNLSNERQLTATGFIDGIKRILKIKLISGDGASFNYGIQVGKGGMSFNANTKIFGNIYSAGDMAGVQNAKVNGSVFISDSPDSFVSQSNGTESTPEHVIVFGKTNAEQDFAQTFRTSKDEYVDKVRFYIRKVGTPQDAYIRISGISSTGLPTNTVFGTGGSLAASKLSTSFGWVDFPISMGGASLPAGEYALTVDTAFSVNSPANYYEIGANKNGYSNGRALVGVRGGTWKTSEPAIITGSDSFFEFYQGGYKGTISYITATGDIWANYARYSNATGKIYCKIEDGNNKLCDKSQDIPKDVDPPISESLIQNFKTTVATGTVLDVISFEKTFNTNVGTGFTGGSSTPAVLGIDVDANGGIFASGGFEFFKGAAVSQIVKLTNSGARDSTFVVGGFTGLNGGAIKVASNGKIYISGNFFQYGSTTANHIISLNPNGTVNTTFNIGSGFTNVGARDIEEDADGNLMFVGDFMSYKGVNVGYIARIKPDGQLDTTFNSGKSGFNISGQYDIELLPDGRMLVGGTASMYNGINTGRLVRLNKDGTRDLSFNFSGSGFSGGYPTDLYVQTDGKILISGTFSSYNGVSAPGLIRLNSDGSIDNNFLTKIGTGFPSGSYAGTESMVVDSSGRIVIGGNFTSFNGYLANRIVRLLPDGTYDENFYSGLGFNDSVQSIVIDKDGSILVGGNFTTYRGQSAVRLVRLSSYGDADFTINGNYKFPGNLKINGNLIVDTNSTLTLGGNLWVTGTIEVRSGGKIKLDSSLGSNSAVIISDGLFTLTGSSLAGTGSVGSYLIAISTVKSSKALSLSNAILDVVYAPYGSADLLNKTQVKSIYAWKLIMNYEATVTYDSGLTNVNFTSGPGGSWKVKSWKEGD